MPTDARTIFEEGVIIPPVKLYRRGVLKEEALKVILNQVRLPHWNRADLNGIVAACRTASGACRNCATALEPKRSFPRWRRCSSGTTGP